jgi:hypothetical protein
MSITIHQIKIHPKLYERIKSGLLVDVIDWKFAVNIGNSSVGSAG